MVQETIDRIEFTFALSDLLEQVNMLSSYSAKNIPTLPTGEDGVDAFGITKDEQSFIDYHLKSALSDLFSIFINQSNAIMDSMFVEVECCGFSIERNACQNRDSLFNKNRLNIIDVQCSNYLNNYILLEWAKSNKIGDDVVVHTNSLNENIRQIRLHNFELKKRCYGKTYDPLMYTV